MAEKIGTRMRYTDTELGVIKNSFAGHEDLMALFRKFLLDGEMTEEETRLLSAFTNNSEVVRILEKAVNPTLDKLAPAFQTVDLFSSLDFLQTPSEHAYNIIKARNFTVAYLKQQFEKLKGNESSDKIRFDSLTDTLPDKDETFIRFMSRNFLLSHIDTQLFNSLMIIAGEKQETAEEQKKRLTKDSSK